MFTISQIPKPDNLPSRGSGDQKYPFGDMKVGDSFVVPFDEMKEGEPSEKFRQRVYKSAREYARREYNARSVNLQDGGKGERKEFTAVVMETDDTEKPPRYAKGDVVVWRDK